MTLVVVDACVAIKWFVLEQDTNRALDLLDDPSSRFPAPDFFRIEVVNGLLRQNRHGHFSDDLLGRALIELDLRMPDLIASGPLLDRAVALARRLRHPGYDCIYLALAERLAAPLVTADEQFVTVCRLELSGEPVIDRLRTLREWAP